MSRPTRGDSEGKRFIRELGARRMADCSNKCGSVSVVRAAYHQPGLIAPEVRDEALPRPRLWLSSAGDEPSSKWGVD